MATILIRLRSLPQLCPWLHHPHYQLFWRYCDWQRYNFIKVRCCTQIGEEERRVQEEGEGEGRGEWFIGKAGESTSVILHASAVSKTTVTTTTTTTMATIVNTNISTNNNNSFVLHPIGEKEEEEVNLLLFPQLFNYQHWYWQLQQRQQRTTTTSPHLNYHKWIIVIIY